jgi:hypothetical protein
LPALHCTTILRRLCLLCLARLYSARFSYAKLRSTTHRFAKPALTGTDKLGRWVPCQATTRTAQLGIAWPAWLRSTVLWSAIFGTEQMRRDRLGRACFAAHRPYQARLSYGELGLLCSALIR